MIIMINGAFGVGKTTVAQLLQQDIANSMIYDPEEVGVMLRSIISTEVMHEKEKTNDFQDLELWPKLVTMIASEIKINYKKHLIVPMTIRNPKYFEYIFNGFKEIDVDTFHFCLKASLDEVHRRLIQRGEKPSDWAFYQTEACINAYENNNFGEYIDAQNIGVREVVTIIKSRVGCTGGLDEKYSVWSSHSENI